LNQYSDSGAASSYFPPRYIPTDLAAKQSTCVCRQSPLITVYSD